MHKDGETIIVLTIPAAKRIPKLEIHSTYSKFHQEFLNYGKIRQDMDNFKEDQAESHYAKHYKQTDRVYCEAKSK